MTRKRIGYPELPHQLTQRDLRDQIPGSVKLYFRLDKGLKKQMTMTLVSSGYGVKGKTKWVCEALEMMFNDPRFDHPDAKIFHAQISELAHSRSSDVGDSITIPKHLWVSVWHTMINTMLYGASLPVPEYVEVTLSDVVVASILNRLARSE